MDKTISVLLNSNPLSSDKTAIAYRIEIQDTQLADWIVLLSLLANGYIDKIFLNSANQSVKFAFSLNSSKSKIYPLMLKENGIPKFVFPAKLLKSVFDLYCCIYRDGKIGIEQHLDIQVYEVEEGLPYQKYYFTFS